MGLKLRSSRGVTLVEILMAGLLLSVVFLACASAYITTLKFFNAVREKSGQLYTFIGMEHVARRVELANDILVNDGGVANAGTGKQVKMRWDCAETGAANNTANNVADDTWVKYRIIEDPSGSDPSGSGTWKLFWRTESAAGGAATDVANSDPQVETALKLGSNSTFLLTSPSGNAVGQKTVLAITLESSVGEPPKTLTLSSDVLVGSKAKA
jgi:Tfp pilus assembly protein PilV